MSTLEFTIILTLSVYAYILLPAWVGYAALGCFVTYLREKRHDS